MSFPRYSKYKDSGVEWLGEVPSDWKPIRARFVLKLVTDRPEGASEYTVALENIESWRGRFIETKTEFAGEGVRFCQGDLLFGKLRPYLAKILVAEREGDAVGDFHVLRPRNANVSGYLKYLFLTPAFINLLDGSTIGARMPRVGWPFLSDVVLPIPDVEEQRLVGEFLDEETAKIDALIEEQRRLIELLKEKRQAVISHAVTKDAKGRPFNLMEFGRAVTRIDQGWSPLAEDRPPEAHEYGVLRLSAVKRGEFITTEIKALDGTFEIPEKLLLRKGDLLVTRANTPELVGDSCYVDAEISQVIFSDLIYRITLDPFSLTHEFANFTLQSALGRSQAKRDARGSSLSMAKLSHSHLKRWTFPVPQVGVQNDIVRSIKAQLAQILDLQQSAHAVIALLQERRSALISAAVTGKIDVRDYKPQPSAFAEEMYEPA